jgi:DNA-binding LacI/PurR family transcriptional regulator
MTSPVGDASRAGQAHGPARHRPTLFDVAASSGVSKSTVSNVVRGAPGVADDTRARVLEAIRTLGYRPSASARNLVQRRTDLLGVVVGDLANAFTAELVKRIEQRASAYGYTTLICNTGGRPEREAARIEALLEQRVDGIALLEFSGDRSVASQLLTERVPVVMVSCWAEYADCVAVDEYAGMALGVEHLVGLGHADVGYVDDALMEPSTRRMRFDAFERALLRSGRSPRPDWCVTWDDPGHPGGGEPALRAVFEGAHRPTALVAANDFTAIRALDVFGTVGVDVPGQVSVVGFDGIAIGGLSRIGLTTVAQPRERLAERGIGLLLDRMARGHDAPLRRQRLEPSLVTRATTAPPPR